MRLGKFFLAGLAAAFLAGCGGGGGGNGTPSIAVFGVTTNNRLVKYELDSANSIDIDVPVTGLNASEEIVGMDFRAANGLLYALGRTGQLYTINTSTGAATTVGSGFGDELPSGNIAFDFNDAVDRIRVILENDMSFRVNPDTGAIVDADPVAPGIQLDSNINPSADISAAAYTPPVEGLTTLYAIDSATNELVRIGGVNGTPSPNTGIKTVVGPLSTNASGICSFDISSGGTAILVVRLSLNTTNVFTVDLTDGGATFVGLVNNNLNIAATAVRG